MSDNEQKDGPAPGREPLRRVDQQERSFATLLREGTALLRSGRVAEAVELLQRAHDLRPDDVDARLNLGGALILANKFSTAVTVLEPLRELDGENPMVWTNLGAAYLGNPMLARDEDQKKAIAAFVTALMLDPRAPSVAYNLGLIYRDRRDPESAAGWFRRAVQDNPNDQDARQLLARMETLLATEEEE